MEHDKRVKSGKGLDVLERVRETCACMLEVEEKVDSFGHSSFRVNNKPFVMIGENDHEGSIAIKTDHASQEILLQQGRYYKTPYIGQHGWVSLRLTEVLDWAELNDLIVEAYLRIAPKRLARRLKE
ncbi:MULTISPECIES: MmcQ/YjbR family DNA-binding protein [unclassified Paenibacillus]|uniref:MmcQ/YjbR family DNA-binding protein n=1 Tax=unclassified Paenibacillus TaxID=185978 RepID=UPI001AEA4BA7|nr:MULTISPECIES: MmcQ/YjbR family DNA-binding protein [unclassified Paenibacillus]MBP1155900.1 putative DNA-binding protein (MmcQ/YjbR family) [Paenibacillus sp. PvP091]MBP1168714.1 putative DNA-binding protein (MmcQ/YjbR family) [Paenibacillus sp. PvR098]MBP2439742.1 putative DNA-binding protein (MmcQ/YjbR family) [Paenibacillus sp. PvP052]